MSICLQIENLEKTFGPNHAVEDLSLEVRTGEVFALLGPNGAGKSTTFHMITGLMRPTGGTITVFGKNLRTHFLDIMPRVGVMPERPAFYGYLTVAKNLQLCARWSAREITLDRTLELVGLRHVANEKVHTLSHGMRQRLGLAQAFLTEPELLILDEPTSGMDVEHTQEVLQLLRRLADEAQVTIILSSHMMHEVETLCDRVAIINHGRLVSCESTDQTMSYDKTSVEVLMDSPESAAKRLAGEAWVLSVEVKPGKLFVRLQEPNPHQLTTFLIGAGYQISGIIPRRRTLQEYFLKVLNQ